MIYNHFDFVNQEQRSFHIYNQL